MSNVRATSGKASSDHNMLFGLSYPDILSQIQRYIEQLSDDDHYLVVSKMSRFAIAVLTFAMN